MKVWDSYIEHKLDEFLTEHGVDMPRAWSLHCRQQSQKRTFEAFLKAEHPIEMAKWRILGNGIQK